MARPQKFNEQQVINKAMMVFWEHGYSGSSIGLLLDEMAISRGTLYNSVGDKDALFKRCLETYSTLVDQLFSTTLLNGEKPARQRMDSFLQLSFANSDMSKLGCLMVNTLCEDDRLVRDVKHLSSTVLTKMETGFERCFLDVHETAAMKLSPKTASSIMATQIKGARVRQREGVSSQVIVKGLQDLLQQLVA